jgi:phosphatidylglycerol:prolipoprotein diacylglycerol transferase
MDIGINPVAFTIGSISVRWYGIFVTLAVITVVLWTLLAAKRGAKVSYETVINAAIVGIPSGIIISRLLHVIDNIVIAKLHPELALSGAVIDYAQHPGQIIGGSGLTIYGAVLGAALGIWVFSLFKKLPYGYLADVIAPGIILAQAVGRVGCTINGCCYGIETNLPWAVVYTHPESFAPLGVPVHPTQIYEVVYNLIVFGVLLLLRGRFRPNGSLFLIYLTLYALWRLGIDFIREGNPFLLGLHEAQVISIIVLIITITLLAWRTRWVKREAGKEKGVCHGTESSGGDYLVE